MIEHEQSEPQQYVVSNELFGQNNMEADADISFLISQIKEKRNKNKIRDAEGYASTRSQIESMHELADLRKEVRNKIQDVETELNNAWNDANRNDYHLENHSEAQKMVERIKQLQANLKALNQYADEEFERG